MSSLSIIIPISSSPSWFPPSPSAPSTPGTPPTFSSLTDLSSPPLTPPALHSSHCTSLSLPSSCKNPFYTSRYSIYCHFCNRTFTHLGRLTLWGQPPAFRRCVYEDCGHDLDGECCGSWYSFPVRCWERWWECWACGGEWSWFVGRCGCGKGRGGEDLVFWKEGVKEVEWREGKGKGKCMEILVREKREGGYGEY